MNTKIIKSEVVLYSVYEWPDCQFIMDEDEAIFLAGADYDTYGDSVWAISSKDGDFTLIQ